MTTVKKRVKTTDYSIGRYENGEVKKVYDVSLLGNSTNKRALKTFFETTHENNDGTYFVMDVVVHEHVYEMCLSDFIVAAEMVE